MIYSSIVQLALLLSSTVISEATKYGNLRRSLSLTPIVDKGAHGHSFGMLGMCEGDCDNDSQCTTGYCHQRNTTEIIPGCLMTGNEPMGHDYCTDEKYRNGPPPVDNNPPTKPPASPPTSPPVDDKSEVKSGGNGNVDVNDKSGGPLVYVEENPNTSEAYLKLQLCEGDCDSDYDCAQGLMCWQRNALEHVPGCDNGPKKGNIYGKDYCVPEAYRGNDGDRFYFPHDSVFRLKLYWEEGYFWQEESFERRWCIECIRDGSCDVGERIFVSECSIKNNALLTFVPIKSNNKYHQIKLADGNVCYQRFGLKMSWQPCDEKQKDQHWRFTDMSGATVDTAVAEKFEIRPRRHLGGDLMCVTQRHHPKDNEWMELEPCEFSHIHSKTTRWNKY